MFRKAILGLSAALILGAAVAPTAALAHGGHHKHHKKHHHKKWDKWSSGYGYGGGYGGCWVKKKVWSDYYGGFVWKKFNVCY